MITTYAHTAGDSTLETLYWTLHPDHPEEDVEEAKQRTVVGRLQRMLDVEAIPYRVVNHAYDGFTTNSLLNGDIVGRVLPQCGQRKSVYLRETIATTSPFHMAKPLEELESAIKADPHAVHYVILSVGGNDFRENLLNPFRLVTDIPKVQQRYLDILGRIQGLGGKNIRPILMFQYRTDANNDPYRIYTVMKIIGIAAFVLYGILLATLGVGAQMAVAGTVSILAAGVLATVGLASAYVASKVIPLTSIKDMFWEKNWGVAIFSALLKAFYGLIKARAERDNIPILDLPTTFNPYRYLYTAGIEPNDEGSELIAEGLHHIITHHDFDSSSKTYAKLDSMQEYGVI